MTALLAVLAAATLAQSLTGQVNYYCDLFLSEFGKKSVFVVFQCKLHTNCEILIALI